MRRPASAASADLRIPTTSSRATLSLLCSFAHAIPLVCVPRMPASIPPSHLAVAMRDFRQNLSVSLGFPYLSLRSKTGSSECFECPNLTTTTHTKTTEFYPLPHSPTHARSPRNPRPKPLPGRNPAPETPRRASPHPACSLIPPHSPCRPSYQSRPCRGSGTTRPPPGPTSAPATPSPRRPAWGPWPP